VVGSRLQLALISLLLIVLPLGLSAQASDSSASPHRKLLLYVDQPPNGKLTENQLLMVSRSLQLILRVGISGLAISDTIDFVQKGSPPDLSALAQKAGADFWLWAQVSTDAGKTHVRVRGFDVPAQATKFDTTVTREGELSPLELPFEKWDDIVSLVTASLPSGEPEGQDSTGPQEVTLTIRALPGTLITGPGGKMARAGGDGFASLNLPGPGEYSLRATVSGYYPETSRFFLAGNTELILNQTPASWWAIDASLLEIGYPSFDVARFIIPNSFYVKLGFTTYAVGLAFTDTHVVTNNPLTNLVFQTGIYLRPEDVLFRPYINLGAFLRIVHAPGKLFGVDPMSWGGFQFSIGTEIGSSPRGRFFFEYQPMMYTASIPGLLQASFESRDPPAGWSFSPKSAFNFLCFRVGYRWAL